MFTTIDDICDYVVVRLAAADVSLNLLKLQKILYYIQAWHLAFYNQPLFQGRFQAWVHGPVNREIYDRFRDTKSLYSPIYSNDIRANFNYSALNEHAVRHVNSVLDVYAQYTGDQLEEMTHQEDPWIAARNGVHPFERCESDIDEQIMAKFYSARLGKY